MEIEMGQANQLAEPPWELIPRELKKITTGQSHSNGMPPNAQVGNMVQQDGQHDASRAAYHQRQTHL